MGGVQTLTFTSKNFNLSANFKVYPLWLDLLYNEVSFNASTLRFCEDLWWYLTTGYFYLDMSVEFNTCSFGAYEYTKRDKYYTCTMETTYLYDIVDRAYGEEHYGNLGINTCKKERPSWVKIDEPGGPKKPRDDMDWEDIEIIVREASSNDAEPVTDDKDEAFF